MALKDFVIQLAVWKIVEQCLVIRMVVVCLEDVDVLQCFMRVHPIDDIVCGSQYVPQYRLIMSVKKRAFERWKGNKLTSHTGECRPKNDLECQNRSLHSNPVRPCLIVAVHYVVQWASLQKKVIPPPLPAFCPSCHSPEMSWSHFHAPIKSHNVNIARVQYPVTVWYLLSVGLAIFSELL